MLGFLFKTKIAFSLHQICVVKVINFNTVVSQGIGRPKGRERDAGEWLVGGAVRTFTFINCLPSYMGVAPGTPKQL